MAQEHDETRRRKRYCARIIKALVLVAGGLGAPCVLAGYLGWPQRPVFIVCALLLFIALLWIHASRLRRTLSYVNPYCTRVLGSWLFRVLLVMVVLGLGMLCLRQKSQNPSPCPTLDRTIKTDLRHDPEAAQERVRELLLGGSGRTDAEFLANALLRYGLIDYERGLLPADEIHELLGLCRCISPECRWPSWTRANLKAEEKSVVKDLHSAPLERDPNTFFVLGGEAHRSQYAAIISELSAQLGNTTGGVPFHIRVIPFSIPSSPDQTVYFETIARCTESVHFAVLGPAGTIRFVAHKPGMPQFLLCPSPALEFPLPSVDWLRVRSYLREHALLLTAYNGLMQGDYYEAFHALEYLQEVISSDSVLGAESCLLKELLYLLLTERQKYLAAQAQIAQWKSNQAFPFVDLMSDIGAAFLSDETDPNELEPIWRKIRQGRNLLSSDQRRAAEALLCIVDAHHRSTCGGVVDLIRSLASIPNQSQWQREQYRHIAEFFSKDLAAGEKRVLMSLQRAIDIAATLRRDDVLLVAHVCAIDAMQDANAVARHLRSIAVSARKPGTTFLAPPTSFLLFPRFFASHREALSTDEWTQLGSLLLQKTGPYIESASKYGTLGTDLRLVATLTAIRTQLGPSISSVVRDTVLKLRPVSFSDWHKALPELMSMAALLAGDRATLVEQLKVWQDWAEFQTTRQEQTFEGHRDSAIILEITALLTLSNGDLTHALNYTESALEHVRVAKEGGYAKSPLLNFLLSEQAFALSLILRQSPLAAQYDVKAEKELAELLSEQWNAGILDPDLLKLGQALVPSVARLAQWTILEKLKPDSWNIKEDPHFRQRDELMRTSCQEVASSLERYFVTQVKAEGLPESLHGEQIAAIGRLFRVTRDAYLALVLDQEAPIATRASLRDMTQDLCGSTPGCGLPSKGPGTALRFVQLIAGDIVRSYSKRSDAGVREEMLLILEPWLKKVASSIRFDEDGGISWTPARIIGVAFKELHSKSEELRTPHVTSTATIDVKVLQVLALLPDTLDAILTSLDKCFSGGMTDDELSQRLLPGVLPEEAMAASVALQFRTIGKLIRGRIATVEADPNMAQTVLKETAAEVANLINTHLQAVERSSHREPFDLLVAEQMIFFVYRGDFVAASQAWGRFDTNAFPPADRPHADTLKRAIYAKLLYKAGNLDAALGAVEQLRREQPRLSQCLNAIAASWHVEKGNIEQASQRLREYFANFDPARDTLRYHWRYRASAPIWDSGNSLEMTVGVDADAAGFEGVVGRSGISSSAVRDVTMGGPLASQAYRHYDLPPDVNSAHTLHATPDNSISFRKGSPEEIEFLRGHPSLLTKYGARYYNEPLHAVYRGAYYGGFRNPWQCALLWAEVELIRHDPNAVGGAVRNLLYLYDHFGSYVSTLNKAAQPAISGIDDIPTSTSSREGNGWLKGEDVQRDLVRLLMIAARADVLGFEEASRAVFAIVRKRFVEPGYADSVCATISKMDKVQVDALRCPSQQVGVGDAVRDWMWIIAISAGEAQLDLSESWVSSLVAEEDNNFRDTWAMYFADKLIDQCARLSNPEKQQDRRLALAATLLKAVADRNARYGLLVNRLRHLRSDSGSPGTP